jgi:hypothetical protein
MSTAKGFAVVTAGQINVATISPHRRAAIVNWLVVARCLPVRDNCTDEQIEGAWRRYRRSDDHLHEVDITIGLMADKS